MYGTWVLWQEKMSSSFQMQRSLIQHGGQEINQILFPSYPLVLDPEVAMVVLLPYSWKIWLGINWYLGGGVYPYNRQIKNNVIAIRVKLISLSIFLPGNLEVCPPN